ncbi:hypothetical protein D3C85_1352970 [compost metagenome]
MNVQTVAGGIASFADSGHLQPRLRLDKKVLAEVDVLADLHVGTDRMVFVMRLDRRSKVAGDVDVVVQTAVLQRTVDVQPAAIQIAGITTERDTVDRAFAGHPEILSPSSLTDQTTYIERAFDKGQGFVGADFHAVDLLLKGATGAGVQVLLGAVAPSPEPPPDPCLNAARRNVRWWRSSAR